MEASAITIYVESVIQDEDRQLRDIKPPIDIPYNYVLLLSVIASILLIGALGYMGYRLYLKRKEKGYILKPPEPKRPAHELAFEALDELLKKDLINAGLIKQFYSELSEIIRRYIEGRYYVPALEETSTEILHELKNQELSEKSFANVKELLQLSDLVKFAKYRPSAEEDQNIVTCAKEFIEETKVIFEFEEKSGPEENGEFNDKELVEEATEKKQNE
jgi:hypothetical protein